MSAHSPSLRLVPPLDLTRGELALELRARELRIIELAAAQLRIAEALWPLGDGARPIELEVAGVACNELVAGVHSLHKLCDLLLQENYALRAQLAGMPSAEGAERG